MPITTDKPIVLNATFDLVAFPSVNITWTNRLNGPVIAQYSFVKYSSDEYGVNLMAPEAPTVVRIPDLYALAIERATAGKPALANALQSVLTALTEIETEKGNI